MQIIDLDISRYELPQTVCAKQGDVGRKFMVRLFDDGVAHSVPEGAVITLWYSGTSGAGNYSIIDGSTAFFIEENSITVEMIAQMLLCRGGGSMCLMLHAADGSQLGMWNIPYVVEPVPGADSPEATQYYTALSEYSVKAAEDAARAEAAANKLVIDDSLSKAGQAADAANTGGRIRRAEKNISELQTELDRNPQMLVGKEYETRELYMGKTVYVKLVDCGTFVSGKEVAYHNPAVSHVVSCWGELYCAGNGHTYSLPYIDESSSYYVSATRTGIVLMTDADNASAYSAYATVRYTKD